MEHKDNQVIIMRENLQNTWSCLLFFIFPLCAAIAIDCLFKNEYINPPDDGLYSTRIGNMEWKNNNTVKIANKVWQKIKPTEADYDEEWDLLVKLNRCNEDSNSKYYGEDITLWVYDISPEIKFDGNNDNAIPIKDYYEYLLDRYIQGGVFRAANNLSCQTAVSTNVYMKVPPYGKKEYEGLVQLVCNKRIYAFAFVQDYEKCRYTDETKTLAENCSIVYDRFCHVISQIDISSYQQSYSQWTEIRAYNEKNTIWRIIFTLIGTLFPLIGIIRIKNKCGNKSPRMGQLAKWLCWFIVVSTIVAVAISLFTGMEHGRLIYVDFYLCLILYMSLVSFPLWVVAILLQQRSCKETIENNEKTKNKEPILQKIIKYIIAPFTFISAIIVVSYTEHKKAIQERMDK